MLERVDSDRVLLTLAGGLTYEVLVPAFVVGRLSASIGQDVTLHTIYYLESQNQGATMLPRLAGFLTEEDRSFFKLFTTCKGVGSRKALRALAMDTGQIAAAIADRDTGLLQSLPEVGRRTAETIVATLSGKVDAFLTATTVAPASAPSRPGTASTPGAGGSLHAMSREALSALIQLGENRVQAVQWIDQALRDPDDRPRDVQALIQRVYTIKAGA